MDFDVAHFSGVLVDAMSDTVIYADDQGMVRFRNGCAGRIAGITAIMRDATKQFEEMRSLRRQISAIRGLGRTPEISCL